MTTLMMTSRTALGALALALAPALWPGDAAAHTCDDPFTTDLVTARGIDVGQVTVCNDAEFLTVTYETTFPWCVLRTNLHVAGDLAGIHCGLEHRADGQSRGLGGARPDAGV